MKTDKITVYVPIEEGKSEIAVSYWERDTHITDVKEEQGYFFTPEQLNEYTSTVIRKALETAAEEANCECMFVEHNVPVWGINKESITDTFHATFKDFEV